MSAAARREMRRSAPASRRNLGGCARSLAWSKPALETLLYVGGDFVRMQSRGMVEYLRSDHEFVGLRPCDECSEPGADRLARTRGGARQNVGEHCLCCGREPVFVVSHRRGKLARPAAA